jgi:hypothetical protein
MKSSALCALVLLGIFMSCRKDSFITSADARLTITADTLKYDTVFVTAGSTYRNFRIINENDQKLLISTVKLMGGPSSPFKMNMDGIQRTEFTNLEIEANDSLHVFVQVNVDPAGGSLPFVLRDSIRINYNGNQRYVQLEAWGQNAHFFRDRVISADETWNNDMPYVILGSLRVAGNRTLNINQGCRIYVHADAPVIVEGSLRLNGLKDTADRVYFQGDRLDAPYNQFPASWPGIFLQPSSKDNVFTYAVISNAYQAIGVSDPSVNASPKLIMNECIIDNAYDAGLISINSSIRARNCQVSNCGRGLVLAKGGTYQFEHCTVASIGSRYLIHQDPVLLLTNFVMVNNTPVTADLNAVFRNCIFWGANGLVEDEVVVSKTGTNPFNVLFEHNLWKVQTPPANISSVQNISNQDPQFDSIVVFENYFNFRLKPTSPAINKGIISGVNTDLDGNPRPVGIPDLGCFEKQ